MQLSEQGEISMTDLRKAAEMALNALKFSQNMKRCFARAEQDYHEKIAPIAIEALRQALAQPEQKKEPTPSNVDPRVLLTSDSDFTKETENRLCDIERRLAAIETQPNEANKKPHAVSYKDGVPVAHYNFDPPPYTAPPSKPWVSLTDEEIAYAVGSPIDEVYLADFRKVEAALRSKNT